MFNMTPSVTPKHKSAFTDMEEEKQVPHVLIVPLPAQAHVNNMLKLAELLCISDLHVTFLTTDDNHHRLLRYSDVQTRFSSFPKFRFETITDGLPDDHPRTIDRVSEMFSALQSGTKPALHQMLISHRFESLNRPPITCMIIDGWMASIGVDAAAELGIPSIVYRTPSACFLWCCYCYRNSPVENGQHPFYDEDLDKLVTCVPGMEGFLRVRDLPGFRGPKEMEQLTQAVPNALEETKISARGSAWILNTFDGLEAPILSQISAHCPKTYTIGPLNLLLTERLGLDKSLSSSNSLREADRSCITWLDAQPSNSVIYVSFGSLVRMTRDQMLEFWYGLVSSGKRFLWVLRMDAIVGKDGKGEIPVELTEGTKERGYMVEWSPQQEVLVHPAVGGFLTHTGWSSVLESILAGVPMLCWPQFGDQLINSRFMSEVWKIGLDMKDKCDRSTVEKMVNDLMDHKSEELRASMDKMSAMAKKSVSIGGSSYCNFEKFVQDIKSMEFKV